jgi:multicomponent Na+:H+ antiporter subunit G
VSGDPSAFAEIALDAASWFCLVVGSAFCLIGGIGMIRMPDFYTRGHAAGITDTLGAGLILIGLMFQAGISLISAKLVMVLFFLYVTSPTSTHALFKSAYAGGMRWNLAGEQARPSRSGGVAGGGDDASG